MSTETNAEQKNGEAAPNNENPVTPSTAAAPELTPAQLEELKIQAAKASEHWDRLLRTTADFDNYKKRALREKQDAVKFANEALLQKLIPVMDNFEMAMAAAASSQGNPSQSLQAGVNMILAQFKSVLGEAGLEEVDASGKPFDPNFHEAVSQLESADVPEGQVLQQIRKGYRLKERLLRPATVIVAKKSVA